jgi:hypothetical protein
MKVYEGIRHPDQPDTGGESIVTANGQILSPKPSQKLHNHSPDGFNWGYGGSGPAQLSLAILYDYFGDKHKALSLYQNFKFKVVAKWPQEGDWKITGAEIEAICEGLVSSKQNQP